MNKKGVITPVFINQKTFIYETIFYNFYLELYNRLHLFRF